jgi:hypothetical protein
VGKKNDDENDSQYCSQLSRGSSHVVSSSGWVKKISPESGSSSQFHPGGNSPASKSIFAFRLASASAAAAEFLALGGADLEAAAAAGAGAAATAAEEEDVLEEDDLDAAFCSAASLFHKAIISSRTMDGALLE